MSRPVARPAFYNFADVHLAVAGIVLSDFDDGGIEVSYVTPDVVESSVSADGLTHVDKVNDPRMRFNIKVKQGSFSADFLSRQAQTQNQTADAGGGLLATNVQLLHPQTGYKVTDHEAYFMTVPGRTFGKGIGSQAMEFVIELPNGRDHEQIGTVNTPPQRAGN